MVLRASLLLFLLGILGSKIGSKSVQAADVSLADAVRVLQQKMSRMEEKLSLLDTMNSKLESKQTAFSTKLGAMQKIIQDQKVEILAKVTELGNKFVQPNTDFSGRLRDIESKSTKIERHFAVEVDQLKSESAEALRKIRSVKQEADHERLKTDILEEKITDTRQVLSSFLAAHNVPADVFRIKVPPSGNNLRLQVNDIRRLGFDGIHSNLSEKIRNVENSISKFEKDCGSVTKLNESVQSLDKNMKTISQTLRTHSSQINGLNGQFGTLSCTSDPPFLENGKPVAFERKPGSTVRYECDSDFILTGNSTVHCNFGDWAGQPPLCSFFDTSFVLVANKHTHVTCYSDENYLKIEFSRVLDTGLGGSLPNNVKIHTEGKAAVLEFPKTNDMENYGVFQCRYNDKAGPMGAIIPFQFPDRMRFKDASIVSSIGDYVELEVLLTLKTESPIRWLHNGETVPSWDNKLKVVIPNVRPTDAGIYECYLETDWPYMHILGRLIVRKCKANMYGENCDKKCPICYNGGVCHDLLGICVCPPGFIGHNCENACVKGHFGADCSKTCPQLDCLNFKFCKPDPYGCSCAPGYNGTRCDGTCARGWYGADCKQPCRCAHGPSDCNRYTGACLRGCLPRWTGKSCQIAVSP